MQSVLIDAAAHAPAHRGPGNRVPGNRVPARPAQKLVPAAALSLIAAVSAGLWWLVWCGLRALGS